MKNFYLLFGLLFCITACSTQKKMQDPNNINGKWTMTSFSAFSPDIPDIERGDIIWDIQLPSNTVTITKLDTEKHSFLGPKAGKHIASKEDKMLSVGNRQYNFSIVDGTLILDSNTNPMLSRDGPVIRFVRAK